MQPTDYPVNHKILHQIWQAYLHTGEATAIDGYHPDPVVVQSWQRCSPRLDHSRPPRVRSLSQTALASMMMAQSHVVSVAVPYIEDMHQFIEGSGSAILLTDGGGCVLTVAGDETARAMIKKFGLGQGAYWTEDFLGTNAIGVAMITAMPVQIVGTEHYNQALHRLTTTAAPIHDVNGRLVGLIAVVCERDIATSHTLSLVMAIGRAISNQLQANVFLEEANMRLAQVNTILETISEGVIAWDKNGRIMHLNKQGGEMLGLSPPSVLGISLEAAVEMPPVLAKAIAAGQELHDVEVSFAPNGNGHSLEALVNLKALGKAGQATWGYMLMMRPMAQVRRMVHRQVGIKAAIKLDDMLADSTAMRAVVRQAKVAAKGTAPVLLHGPGGVGKNHLARAIHNASRRAHQPFIAINCRALPRELLMGELMGIEQNGQPDGRPSKFELADGGTLFLDRIESLTLEMQSVLLQVIETGMVMRLGSQRPVAVDVRIMAATSVRLEEAVAEGSFISHLYYRFGVFNIDIPSLRQRREDILRLADGILGRLRKPSSAPVSLSEEALSVMQAYPWPGNVRELEMVMERALHMCQGSEIQVVDLPEVVRNGRVVMDHSPQPRPVLSAEEAEREAIIRAGWACDGKVTAMAEKLGIGRTTLWRKMKRMNISADYFKNGKVS